jgi:hypothetical protein
MEEAEEIISLFTAAFPMKLHAKFSGISIA